MAEGTKNDHRLSLQKPSSAESFLKAFQESNALRDIAASEQLKSETSVSSLFQNAFAQAKDLYLSSPYAKEAAQRAGLTWEQVEKAVKEQDYTSTTSLTPQREILVGYVTMVQRMGRMILRQVLHGENAVHLSEMEKTAAIHSLDIADNFDGFRKDWMESVAANSLVDQTIQECGGNTGEAKRLLLERAGFSEDVQKLNYFYVVFQRDAAGEVKAIPYREAFKKHFDKIIDSYRNMRDEFLTHTMQGSSQDRYAALTLVEYLTKLIKALDYSGNNPLEQDKAFQDAEIAWTKAMRSSTVFFQHPMEAGYFGQLGIEVEPEFVFGILDDKEAEINSQADSTREKMLPELQRLFPEGTDGHKALMHLFPTMQQSRLRAYAMIVGGTHIEFRPLAANLPNRPKVRETVGVHINADMQTYDQRASHIPVVLERIFGEESEELHEYKKNSALYRWLEVGVFTAGHEIGHNAFMMQDTESRLTPKLYHLVEENKADLVGIVTAPAVLDHNSEQMESFVREILYKSLRNLEKIHSSELRPYVNGSLMYLNILSELGILTSENGVWKTDFTPKKVSDFFEACTTRLRELAKIYEQGNATDVQGFIDTYYVESSAIKELEERLGITSLSV